MFFHHRVNVCLHTEPDDWRVTVVEKKKNAIIGFHFIFVLILPHCCLLLFYWWIDFWFKSWSISLLYLLLNEEGAAPPKQPIPRPKDATSPPPSFIDTIKQVIMGVCQFLISFPAFPRVHSCKMWASLRFCFYHVFFFFTSFLLTVSMTHPNPRGLSNYLWIC